MLARKSSCAELRGTTRPLLLSKAAKDAAAATAATLGSPGVAQPVKVAPLKSKAASAAAAAASPPAAEGFVSKAGGVAEQKKPHQRPAGVATVPDEKEHAPATSTSNQACATRMDTVQAQPEKQRREHRAERFGMKEPAAQDASNKRRVVNLNTGASLNSTAASKAESPTKRRKGGSAPMTRLSTIQHEKLAMAARHNQELQELKRRHKKEMQALEQRELTELALAESSSQETEEEGMEEAEEDAGEAGYCVGLVNEEDEGEENEDEEAEEEEARRHPRLPTGPRPFKIDKDIAFRWVFFTASEQV